MRWTAVVLAGTRASGDAVADHCGVPVKALAEVAGEPMLVRVLRALDGVDRIADVRIVGDAGLLAPAVDGLDLRIGPRWIEPLSSPATSLSRAFEAIASDSNVLVTTSDHALLKREWVAEFIDRVEATDGALALALVSAESVRSALPQSKRTVIKFSNARVCTCNLFAFLKPEARTVARTWAAQEGMRKSPLRLLARLGLVNALLYALGVLDLKGAFARLSHRFGIAVAPVLMSSPLLAVDVDTPEDLALCRQLAEHESPAQ